MFVRSCMLGVTVVIAWLGAATGSAWAQRRPVPVQSPPTDGVVSAVNLQRGYFDISTGTATARFHVGPATRVVIVTYSGVRPPPGSPPIPPSRTPGTLANLAVGQTVQVHAHRGRAQLIEIVYFAP
jgi:hypothetical protein